MGQTFEVTWEAEVSGPPDDVGDAVTRHAEGWLWPITYEPRVGGSETGPTASGGQVTNWEPERRFTTTATDAVGTNQLDDTFATERGTAEHGGGGRRHRPPGGVGGGPGRDRAGDP